MADATDTAQLRALQDERHTEEMEAVRKSTEPAEKQAHRRRADKAAYLRERLAEAERSEREGG